jgi:preprotein translocase subunit YajC
MGPAPAGQGQTSTAPSWVNFVPLLLMVFVFYFVFIRPQQKKSKELQNLLGSLKSGDKVVTTSGIVGTVVTVKDRTVSLRSSDTKLEVLKSAIAEITERGSSESTESKS